MVHGQPISSILYMALNIGEKFFNNLLYVYRCINGELSDELGGVLNG